MPKSVRAKRRPVHNNGLIETRDHGPGHRIDRGDIVSEYRPDPNSSVAALVRGGRVRDGLQTMWARKTISWQQFSAGCRFRDDIDFAGGAHLDRPESLGIRVQQAGNQWPSDVQIDAMARVRDAREALATAGVLHVATAVLRDGMTLDDYARVVRTRRGDVGTQMSTALDTLVDFYDARPMRRGVA